MQKTITDGVRLLENNTGMKLVVAANYGGRWDIAQAARRVSDLHANGDVSLDEIDEKLFESCLSLGSDSIDLLIRSSGEQRLSNFILWHLAYSELYFTDTLWPDFDASELDKAVGSYQNRDRRFGQRNGQ